MLFEYDRQVDLDEVGDVVPELAMAVTYHMKLKVLTANLVWQGSLKEVSQGQSDILSDFLCTRCSSSINSDLIYVYWPLAYIIFFLSPIIIS